MARHPLMNSEQRLWERIKSFRFDEGDAAFPFVSRLARDNGWSSAYAVRAITEYRKFVFVAIMAGHPVTPSDQVDQVLGGENEGARVAIVRLMDLGYLAIENKKRNKWGGWYETSEKRIVQKADHLKPNELSGLERCVFQWFEFGRKIEEVFAAAELSVLLRSHTVSYEEKLQADHLLASDQMKAQGSMTAFAAFGIDIRDRPIHVGGTVAHKLHWQWRSHHRRFTMGERVGLQQAAKATFMIGITASRSMRHPITIAVTEAQPDTLATVARKSHARKDGRQHRQIRWRVRLTTATSPSPMAATSRRTEQVSPNSPGSRFGSSAFTRNVTAAGYTYRIARYMVQRTARTGNR